MITRIELKNFMSHENTVIEPARGLTVISGPNNCGKSAIVTALQILCYNDESTFVMRHGEKECSIKVFTDDGHEIEWIRTKSKSTKYMIDGQQHDRLGRGGTPEDLHKILKIQKVSCDNTEFDVHFGSQQSPVFLLNDSPRAAAQFFASSSDAINLIGMQTRHKQKVRDRKQEKRRLTGELKETTQKLDRLDAVPELSDRLQKLTATYQTLKHGEEEIAALHNQLKAIEEKTAQVKKLGALAATVRPLTSPPGLFDTSALERCLVQTRRNFLQLQAATAHCGALADLPGVPEFAETDGMEATLKAMQTSAKEFESLVSKTEVLKPLQVPPPQRETVELANAISKLSGASQIFDRANRQMEACVSLAEPPDLPSTQELEQALCRLGSQSEQLVKMQESIGCLSEELEQSREKMEDWVELNPSCPTCGSELSTEQLLAGAHRHG